MSSIFAWQELPMNGDDEWGTIEAIIPELGYRAQLAHRRYEVAMRMRPVALGHAKASGHPVRLVRFDEAEILELH